MRDTRDTPDTHTINKFVGAEPDPNDGIRKWYAELDDGETGSSQVISSRSATILQAGILG